MILFLYGEDNYRLNQKVKALKERFISASLGDTNLAMLDAVLMSFDDIVRQTLAIPFLAKSRLVMVNNLFSAKKDVIDKVTEFLSKVPKTTVFVITQEGNPDKRTSLFKKLNQPKISQEFKSLEGEGLRRWVQREVEVRKAKCEMGATDKLIAYIGNDLWRMSAELDKLVSYDPKITVENIELLVQPQVQSNIFNLMDEIAAKNTQAAAKELNKLLREGKAEPYILSMIVLEYRNLLIVKDLIERSKGRINRWAIAKKVGLHPYVAQKTLVLVGKYEFSALKKIYQLLSDFDTKIKTGKMEGRVALELLVFKLTRK
ncbi:MAG: DNA polymerase III subunit delta [Patescibacteria group bacterium]|jgi:DNA polymerase-3 subunit delta